MCTCKEAVSKRPIYTPQSVANYFLKKAKDECKPLTPLKLIKLVYIAYGWVLATLNLDLFDDDIEAWQHGPVIPALYHEFKIYGNKPVTEYAVNLQSDGSLVVPEISPSNPHRAITMLEKVWDVYKNLTGSQLRDLTHQKGTPWRESYKEGVRHIVIPRDMIQQHYIQILSKMVHSKDVA